jgi:hypothetical protein
VHAAGLVHRDFKPANVLVGKDGRARVTDFGVVRAHHAGAPAPATPPPSPTAEEWRATITDAGNVAGTPRYMAPEIFEGQPADVRSDIYSFCLALYEALYHQHPFADEPTPVSPLDAVPRVDVPMPSLTTPVPAWVGRAVVAGLRLDPAARPSSMSTLLAALSRDPRESRLRWLQQLMALVLALSMGAVVLAAWRAQKANRAQLCAAAAQQLRGVWDEDARREVEAALLGTKQPFAPNAWRNLRATLDGYAGAWAEMHRDACLATRLRGHQSDAVLTLRMACLEQRRQSLSAVVDVLAHADVSVVERAEQAATGLPSLERCADVPALLAEVPPPEDPAERARVLSLRAQLARVAPLRPQR